MANVNARTKVSNVFSKFQVSATLSQFNLPFIYHGEENLTHTQYKQEIIYYQAYSTSAFSGPAVPGFGLQLK